MQSNIQASCLLSTAYMPPVEYFAAMANSDKVLVEKCEMFQKQSYRTRCHIYSANGLLALTVPVRRNTLDGTALQQPQTETPQTAGEEPRPSHKLFIDDILIDYSKPWVQQHERAIEAAYMTTPIYEYYKDDIFAILRSGEPSLFELNRKFIELFNELIGISTPIEYTAEWRAEYSDGGDAHSSDACGVLDLRNRIHPKYKGEDMLDVLQIKKPYWQVFSHKQGFIPNLSVLDLLCNEGPNSISFLKIL